MSEPFIIPSASVELQASYVSAINRVLYDIAHELDRKLNPRTLEPRALAEIPIRMVFKPATDHNSAQSEDGVIAAEHGITVTPIPFQFNRSCRVWSQAAVLDWNLAEREMGDALGFDFLPTALIPGFLYERLEGREQGKRDQAITYLIGQGSSRDEGHSEFYSCQFHFENYCESEPLKKQKEPPEWLIGEGHNGQRELKLDQLERLYLGTLKEIDPLCQRFIVVTPIYDIRPYGLSDRRAHV